MPAKEHFFKNENHFASSGCSLFICHAQSISSMFKITSKKKKNNQSGLWKLKAEISNAEKAFFMFSASHMLTLIVVLCFLKYHLACVCGITCTAPENQIQVDESRREELPSWSILLYYIFFLVRDLEIKLGLWPWWHSTLCLICWAKEGSNQAEAQPAHLIPLHVAEHLCVERDTVTYSTLKIPLH